MSAQKTGNTRASLFGAARNSLAFALAAGAATMATPALAQGATDALEEDIVITATKRGDANVQDVPLAVTAFGQEQLEALNFRDVSSLSYSIPNVQLEDNGTAPGYANFSIRGLGINSSIPSIDPTVGIFVDGVYQGISGGQVFDNFDLEGVEVLRGPQGILFGRNVTGGAVLLRTTTPSDELRVNGGFSVETGPNFTVDAMVTGPIVQDVLSGKIAVYHNQDTGYFENVDGRDLGEQELGLVRGALRWTPTESVEFILRGESGRQAGDGAISQNHDRWSRDSQDFGIDERGFSRADWDSATLETNIDVAFGDGTITNIVGWRQYESRNRGDIDGTTSFLFHANAITEQDQISEELRYAGTFGNLALTTGLYYFQQDLFYIENRELFGGGLVVSGGGEGDFSTWGAFVAGDYALTETFTINLGVRYTHEEKEVEIATLRPGGADLQARTFNADFTEANGYPTEDSWNDISPRVGFQWTPSNDTQVYGFWAKGFRSGGYNFRQTAVLSPTVTPGPFDEEEQTTIEFGVKQDFMDGRGRINAAIFHNEIEGMQRELNTAGPFGTNQQIVNAADATIQGVEIEARYSFTDNFLVQLQAGYTDGEYDAIFADISNPDPSAPQVIDGADFALEIPRLSPWTYGLTFIYDLDIADAGTLSSRLSWSHRDRNFFTDTNLGFFPAVDIVDLNLTFRPTDSNVSFSLYGENLTDETTYGGNTVLPSSVGGDVTPALATFSPLNKGRVIGFEMRYSY